MENGDGVCDGIQCLLFSSLCTQTFLSTASQTHKTFFSGPDPKVFMLQGVFRSSELLGLGVVWGETGLGFTFISGDSGENVV